MSLQIIIHAFSLPFRANKEHFDNAIEKAENEKGQALQVNGLELLHLCFFIRDARNLRFSITKITTRVICPH